MRKTNSQNYVSDKQVADRYGVARGTIWRWVREGHFPRPKKLGPSCTRWPVDTIQRWEQDLEG